MNTATATLANLSEAAPLSLVERIALIRFYDIAALCKEVKGDTLGFDINRKFSGAGSKARFAEWAVSELDNAALLAALPKYEEIAKDYYAKNKPKGFKPSMAKAPAPKPKPAAPKPEPQDAPATLATAPKIETVPMPADAPQTADLKALVADILAKAGKMDLDAANAVRAWCAAEIEAATNKARPIIVTVNNGGTITSNIIGRQHKSFERLLKLCAVRNNKGTGLNLWMTGPAGSGKTTAAENCATALGIPFKFSGAVDNEFKLMGFINAAGVCVRTAFREAYEHGGVFLLDEVDGCHPAALLALNAALANGYCDFPDGEVKRHKDCVIIAAANTWGQGATHEYVGRAKLDAASLDRFVMMAWDYDEELERDTAPVLEWTRYVQAVRAKARSIGEKVIISPRASYDGGALLQQGFTKADAIELVLRKGISEQVWSRIAA